jgi:hypothetical protein
MRWWREWSRNRELDMLRLTAGVAVAGLTSQFTERDGSLARAGLTATVLVSAHLILTSFHRLSITVVEERWRQKLHTISEETALGVQQLDAFYSGHFLAKGLKMSWRDYARVASWPVVTRTPLREWDSYLTNHSENDVRQLYAFAKVACTDMAVLPSYRRLVIRTFREFGDWLDEGQRGFAEFLEREEVKRVYREIIVMIGYMEIARAHEDRSNARGDVESGFWRLGERWSDLTIALPR